MGGVTNVLQPMPGAVGDHRHDRLLMMLAALPKDYIGFVDPVEARG